jgi:hypothetical protein
VEISSFLDFDNSSKELILRRFQKSGRQFTGFQKICKAFFVGKGPVARPLAPVPARFRRHARGVERPGRKFNEPVTTIRYRLVELGFRTTAADRDD